MFRSNTPRTQRDRLQCLIEAARETEYYRPILPLSGEISLSDLPCIGLEEFEANPQRFLARYRQNVRPVLRYPFRPEPVVKLLSSGFAPARWIIQPSEEGSFDTLAGPVPALRRLTSGGTLRYPCIAFSGSYGELTAEDRDLFWKRFRVPVFEHLIGTRGEVLAEECEAHSGLHVREEAAILEDCSGELVVTSLQTLRYPVFRLRTGLHGHLERAPCGCGASTPRLVGLRAAHASSYTAAAIA